MLKPQNSNPSIDSNTPDAVSLTNGLSALSLTLPKAPSVEIKKALIEKRVRFSKNALEEGSQRDKDSSPRAKVSATEKADRLLARSHSLSIRDTLPERKAMIADYETMMQADSKTKAYQDAEARIAPIESALLLTERLRKIGKTVVFNDIVEMYLTLLKGDDEQHSKAADQLEEYETMLQGEGRHFETHITSYSGDIEAALLSRGVKIDGTLLQQHYRMLALKNPHDVPTKDQVNADRCVSVYEDALLLAEKLESARKFRQNRVLHDDAEQWEQCGEFECAQKRRDKAKRIETNITGESFDKLMLIFDQLYGNEKHPEAGQALKKYRQEVAIYDASQLEYKFNVLGIEISKKEYDNIVRVFLCMQSHNIQENAEAIEILKEYLSQLDAAEFFSKCSRLGVTLTTEKRKELCNAFQQLSKGGPKKHPDAAAQINTYEKELIYIEKAHALCERFEELGVVASDQEYREVTSMFRWLDGKNAEKYEKANKQYQQYEQQFRALQATIALVEQLNNVREEPVSQEEHGKIVIMYRRLQRDGEKKHPELVRQRDEYLDVIAEGEAKMSGVLSLAGALPVQIGSRGAGCHK